ncbi:MAG: TRAP transporter large permease subunit [Planctomycetes bacterium]|nr:TRAP transporter large permease subunit [Planctomycetota bacterium]
MAVLVVLALLGLPLFLVLFGVALAGFHSGGQELPAVFVDVFHRMTESPIFLTIPLFAHAGFVLSESRAPERLVELVRAALGWMPGGAAVVTIVACALFTAFTGASGVTIIALGGLLLPVLSKERYPDRFNLGLVTTCGSLGLLFPPSLPLIVYVLVASQIAPVGVGTLFVAGAVPGLLLVVVLALYGAVVGVRRSGRERASFSPARVAKALRGAAFEIPVPILLVGGIFGGFLTLAQAAAAVAAYVTLVEVFVHRDLSLADLWRTTTRSMVLVGGILAVVMGSLALTDHLTDQEVPRQLLGAMREHLTSPLAFLLLLNVFLLVVGCLMDVYSAILVVVPLVLPVALSFGVDPVHLGIVFLTNLEIGYSTPPVGINLFISGLRFKKPVLAVARASLPFLGLLGLSLAAITFIPWLSLGLVRAVEGTGTAQVRWAPREGIGKGTLRWARRAQEADPDSGVWLAAPDGADRRESGDLTLRFQSVLRGEEKDIAAGKRPVNCRFSLARASQTGWTIAASWQAKIRTLADLAGTEADLESVSIVPADSALSRIPLEPRNWTEACRARVLSVEGTRVRGRLEAVVLWFPDDPDAPEEIYDLGVDFDCLAESAGQGARDLPPDAPSRELPDVDLRFRRPPGKEPWVFLLDRVRPRPWKLSATWRAQVESLEELAGFEGELDSFEAVLEDVPREEFPAEGSKFLAGKVLIERVEGDEIEGTIRAVLEDPATRRAVDVEVRFRLEARPVGE